MKQSRIILILLSICILSYFTSCRQDTVQEGIIDTATLAAFTSEALLLEAYTEELSSRQPDSAEYFAKTGYDSLYSKYGITPEDYDSSMRYYYINEPDNLKEVYGRVTERLRKFNDNSHTKL